MVDNDCGVNGLGSWRGPLMYFVGAEVVNDSVSVGLMSLAGQLEKIPLGTYYQSCTYQTSRQPK